MLTIGFCGPKNSGKASIINYLDSKTKHVLVKLQHTNTLTSKLDLLFYVTEYNSPINAEEIVRIEMPVTVILSKCNINLNAKDKLTVDMIIAKENIQLLDHLKIPHHIYNLHGARSILPAHNAKLDWEKIFQEQEKIINEKNIKKFIEAVNERNYEEAIKYKNSIKGSLIPTLMIDADNDITLNGGFIKNGESRQLIKYDAKLFDRLVMSGIFDAEDILTTGYILHKVEFISRAFMIFGYDNPKILGLYHRNLQNLQNLQNSLSFQIYVYKDGVKKFISYDTKELPAPITCAYENIQLTKQQMKEVKKIRSSFIRYDSEDTEYTNLFNLARRGYVSLFFA